MADGRLSLTVLDVGQGDALVLRSPSGRAWVIDAGGSFAGGPDLGETVVGPYLWSQGVRRLDAMLLTHAHPDHVGGAAFVVGAFRPRRVLEGPAPRAETYYARLEAALRDAGVTRLAVARSVHDVWEGAAVSVLGPRGHSPWRVRNDDSVVVGIGWGDVRFLLAGDIEADAEAALGRWPAQVLKVPHHGSRTSSTPGLIAGVAPRLAIISVGRRNRFGHPDPEVLLRYRQAGIRVLRTDQEGAISVATDGKEIWVRSFRDGRWERLP